MIAIAAIFRNEAPYLREWIEFHRIVGVKKFFLFNNLSTDPFLPILEPYIDRGIVELTHWPLEHSHIAEWNEIQCLAYERAIHKAKGKIKWLAIIDVDEFLFSPQKAHLLDLLSLFEDAGGVGVNWQTFSAVPQIPQNQTLIETLTHKFAENIGTNHHVKSIVRPDRVKACENPHFVLYKPSYSQVTTEGVPFEGCLSPSVRIDLLRVNHYTLRDETYFKEKKIPRLKKWWEGEIDWEAKYKGGPQIEDLTICRFVPQLRNCLRSF